MTTLEAAQCCSVPGQVWSGLGEQGKDRPLCLLSPRITSTCINPAPGRSHCGLRASLPGGWMRLSQNKDVGREELAWGKGFLACALCFGITYGKEGRRYPRLNANAFLPLRECWAAYRAVEGVTVG